MYTTASILSRRITVLDATILIDERAGVGSTRTDLE